MFNRRHMLASTAAMGLSLAAGSAVASRSQRAYTADTTPFASARSILRRRPRDLHAGSSGPHDIVQTLHLNFAKLVEYNFARLDNLTFERAWQGLTLSEAVMLASMYDRSITDSGSQPRLLELVAERAEQPVLMRVAQVFDNARMEEALMRFAPGKLLAYRASAHLRSDMAGHPLVTGLPGTHSQVSPMSGPNLDYTFREIYLSYRTAPIGALGITGSLYEATMYASRHLAVAYGGGYAFGTAIVAPLIREFSPSLWNSIGATVHHTVQALSTALDVFTSASEQRQAADTFLLPNQTYTQLQETGGDFGVVWNWHQIYIGGGGVGPGSFCQPFDICPPMEAF